MEQIGFSTPDPNLGLTGDKTTPPPPPKKDAAKAPEGQGVNQNLDLVITEAASSSDSDPVIRERTLAELHRQISFLQAEVIRKQAKATRIQPAKSLPEPPLVTPSAAKATHKRPLVSVLAPKQGPLAPKTDLLATEIGNHDLRSSSYGTPLQRHRGDPSYEEEGDSDYRPSKRSQLEDMREIIKREMAEAKQHEAKEGSSELPLSLSPLSSKILSVRFSRKFTTPVFERYEGSTDPMDHLHHFQDVTAAYSYDDALLCRMFPASLKGTASKWFYSLKPESLHNFKHVVQAFVSQYASFQEHKKNRNHLFTLRMADDESLKKYLTRFQTERALIHDCSDDVASAAFINGLHVKSKFYSALMRQNVADMKEILRLAPDFIQLEDARRSTRDSKTTDKPKPETHGASHNKGSGVNNSGGGGRRSPNPNNFDPNNFNNQMRII